MGPSVARARKAWTREYNRGRGGRAARAAAQLVLARHHPHLHVRHVPPDRGLAETNMFQFSFPPSQACCHDVMPRSWARHAVCLRTSSCRLLFVHHGCAGGNTVTESCRVPEVIPSYVYSCARNRSSTAAGWFSVVICLVGFSSAAL